MSSLFWNVREFNKPLKHSIVKEWVGKNDLLFGSILETRVNEKKTESMLSFVFRGWSYMINYEYSQGGRI